MILLQLRKLIPKKHLCIFSRSERSSPRHAPDPHMHDYYEIIWIEAGKGCHHINGRVYHLQPGSCFLINTRDRHAFSVGSTGKLRLVHVAFFPASWNFIHSRYFKNRPDPFKAALARRQFNFPPPVLSELRDIIRELESAGRSRSTIERFLLNFFCLFYEEKDSLKKKINIPAWIENACRVVAKPEHFQNGTRALAVLAGHCPEYVARAMRHYVGKTPTEILNEARMAYAAKRLAESDEKIINIVMDCGFQNPAHFYHLFKLHFGTSPRNYRIHRQRIVWATRDQAY